MAEGGLLADRPNVAQKDRWYFRLIQPVFSGNNFGMVHVRPGDQEPTLTYALFGNVPGCDDVVKKAPLVIA